ncbi:thermonuclease family protein [Kallotenue papyrolyticum]|uniref:thermonuclease family protein n=1 Tax=Kallotenue papyrolyticum TaxID=1325125 RepID=UPI0004785B74|nr:thermonuclease family protein [Kallotenue papyrolyticum]
MRPVLTLLAALLALGAALVPEAMGQRDHVCFAQTGQCLAGRFRQYWEQNGGLPVFGFPISAQAPALNRDTGQTYVTQWMERNRFELHPENATPYDVLLGRLGVERLQQLGIDWQTLPKANPSDPHYFPQTGQAISFEPFWQYWRTHGLELGDRGISERESLALFGYPISPARMETNSSGDTVLTQWFERARFEWHPTNPEPYKVLLGLLGNELHATAPVPPAADYPQPPAGLPSARVVAVIDGDTIEVQLGAVRERLRMIGIDTPETVDPRRPVECFGREAAAMTRRLLDGQRVLLEDDPSQETRDRYGRILRYVWLPDGRLVNLELIAQGYAHEYTYAQPYKYQAIFRAAEARARRLELGLWSPATCNGDSDRPAPGPVPTPVAGAGPIPIPSPPSSPSGSRCHPSYPDVCIPPPPPDLDCGELPFRRFRVLPPDPHRLDSDRDGVGCER